MDKKVSWNEMAKKAVNNIHLFFVTIINFLYYHYYYYYYYHNLSLLFRIIKSIRQFGESYLNISKPFLKPLQDLMSDYSPYVHAKCELSDTNHSHHSYYVHVTVKER